MKHNDNVGVSDVLALQVERGVDLLDGIKLTGHLLVELWDEEGRLKETREVDNLVVTAGKNFIADRLSTTPGSAAMGWMAVGTGSTSPAAGDTALGTELDRNALTSMTDAANVVTYVGDWAAGDATNSAIAEAGIFNQSSLGGTMLARATFTAINKGAGDTLKITWTVTIS